MVRDSPGWSWKGTNDVKLDINQIMSYRKNQPVTTHPIGACKNYIPGRFSVPGVVVDLRRVLVDRRVDEPKRREWQRLRIGTFASNSLLLRLKLLQTSLFSSREPDWTIDLHSCILFALSPLF